MYPRVVECCILCVSQKQKVCIPCECGYALTPGLQCSLSPSPAPPLTCRVAFCAFGPTTARLRSCTRDGARGPRAVGAASPPLRRRASRAGGAPGRHARRSRARPRAVRARAAYGVVGAHTDALCGGQWGAYRAAVRGLLQAMGALYARVVVCLGPDAFPAHRPLSEAAWRREWDAAVEKWGHARLLRDKGIGEEAYRRPILRSIWERHLLGAVSEPGPGPVPIPSAPASSLPLGRAPLNNSAPLGGGLPPLDPLPLSDWAKFSPALRPVRIFSYLV